MKKFIDASGSVSGRFLSSSFPEVEQLLLLKSDWLRAQEPEELPAVGPFKMNKTINLVSQTLENLNKSILT